MKPLLLVALLGCLASAATADTVTWCVKSHQEEQKCASLAAKYPGFLCTRRAGTQECITAIQADEADAITLDGGDIYTAGLNHELHPIIAEHYGDSSATCYYAVAVVKKNTGFGFHELKGRKSCHTGLGKSAGWNIPIGTLLSMELLNWDNSDNQQLEEAVGNFFLASCVPGGMVGSKLCELCMGDCSRTHSEPYYDYSGAFQCLKDGKGEVAFVKHLTVPADEWDNYELLCKDNKRAPISSYKSCNLVRVPAHAVITRKDPQLADRIWNKLSSMQASDLFSSAGFGAQNLIFKDSTTQLVRLPPNTDSYLYLGAEYMSITQSIKRVQTPATTSNAIRWCAVGEAETSKCDSWSSSNLVSPITCQAAATVDECLRKILKKEADAMTVDGGQVYTAGKCGLVPVMAEQYDQSKCSNPEAEFASYYAVAVVKRSSGLTWDKLRGKRSCHTGFGRTAGWNIPMGLIHNQTGDCDFSKFFPSGCAPGSDLNSTFCKNCKGRGDDAVDTTFHCKSSAEERYNSYIGAFRCLVEDAGDVAFIKHTIVPSNSDGNGVEWARGLQSADYALICPGKGQVAVTDHASCHLAKVPAHAVVTRPDLHNKVVSVLKDQQVRFGNDNPIFSLFKSGDANDLLFKSNTKCLQEIKGGTDYAQFLGEEYRLAMNSLRVCSGSTPDLEKSCTFHSCQQRD